jgi:hypothetical protein
MKTEMKMNKEHGSPYDLGSADSYYRRPIRLSKEFTKEQEIEYLQGYWDQEATGDHKDYGDDD